MAAKKTDSVATKRRAVADADKDDAISGIGRRRHEARAVGSPDYAARRRTVLDAAEQVFQQNGYRGTKLAQISKLLGGDRASIYYYFSGKHDLFRALVYDAVMANTLRAEEIRDSTVPSIERIRTLVHDAVMSFEQHPALSVFALEDDRTLEGEPGFDDLRDLNRRYADALHEILDQAIAERAIDIQSSQAATILIMGALNWANRWFRPQRELTGEELAELISTFVIRGLSAHTDPHLPKGVSESPNPTATDGSQQTSRTHRPGGRLR